MSEKLIVGQINGVFGVHGWVKIFSDTEPRENIFSYSPWWIKRKGEWLEVKVEDFKGQQGGKALVAKLDIIEDRDLAREYMGCEIAIDRTQLRSDDNEFFWIDLIGCQVENLQGEVLGEVTDLIETGAHDVLRVKGATQELIPYVLDEFIIEVDIANKRIKVDWQAEESE
ncbi:ribosome maturation factor RimM [Thiomicrorhabdus heinhorstiae]|uniref:Ribosome maturation factor RimM n=1 Tax=Thiomicrorhabdus heinhorstiae TaxID=2748010 RepID=A0ABS0BVU6_9GAMM|nr:ribosome maturation factor RimM [Thiomicrorhabdus heinhorstiae]MBF6057203.1 ribosome maturation factor RimM [Thiomicrorhabdus heinhorstiae]